MTLAGKGKQVMQWRNRFRLGVPAVALCSALAAAGCSSLGLESDKIDYRSVQPQRPLDVPPDLTQLPSSPRYEVPGMATASGVASQPRPGAQPAGGAVAPAAPSARIERAGSQRWLAVDLPPEKAFEVVREFWPSVGLGIEREDPSLGIVETNWVENRAKLPQDIIRRTIGRVFENLYSTGEQDKFRARVERTVKNTSEIFISHRGMVEVYTTAAQDSTRWQPRPSDPELEAEMLQRLLLRFVPATSAAAREGPAAMPTAAAPPQQVARLVRDSSGAAERLEVEEPFDRAWRRVGLALDRGGFTVEERDRTQGLYAVRYLDPDHEARQRAQRGLLSRLFGRDAPVDAQQFRVRVSDRAGRTEVTVVGVDDQPGTRATAEKILSLLHEQLR